MEELYAKLISEIVAARKAAGLSQKKLADICGLPQSTIARTEARTNSPSVETLLKILAPLGKTLTLSDIESQN